MAQPEEDLSSLEVGNIWEMGVNEYGTRLADLINQKFKLAANVGAKELGLITSSSKYEGLLTKGESAVMRRTSKTIASGLVKKHRKENPFIPDGLVCAVEGTKPGMEYRVCMLLKHEPSVIRYIEMLKKFCESGEVPIRVSHDTVSRSEVRNPRYHALYTELGVEPGQRITGVFFDLSNSSKYIDSKYGKGVIRRGGAEYRVRISNTTTPKAAPHLTYYLPDLCQVMKTLTRKVICFHNVSL